MRGDQPIVVVVETNIGPVRVDEPAPREIIDCYSAFRGFAVSFRIILIVDKSPTRTSRAFVLGADKSAGNFREGKRKRGGRGER